MTVQTIDAFLAEVTQAVASRLGVAVQEIPAQLAAQLHQAAETGAFIAQGVAAGTLSASTAGLRLEALRNTLSAIDATGEELSVQAVQDAANAALAVLRAAINRTVGLAVV